MSDVIAFIAALCAWLAFTALFLSVTVIPWALGIAQIWRTLFG